MKSRIVFFLALISSSFVFAQRMTREEYIEKYKDLAIVQMKEHKIPASITLAQGLLESDNGNSLLATKAKNHFGIKCHSSWTGKKIYKDDDAKDECFRVYKSAKDSYEDHSDFLLKPRYAPCFKLKMTDYKGWAKQLQKCGYATNKRYPELLISIIEANDLQQYDDLNSKPKKKKKEPEPVEVYNPNNPDMDNEFDEILVGVPQIKVSDNSVKYVVLAEKMSVEEVSLLMQKGRWEIKSYNDVEQDHTFSKGDIVYLQPKKNKSSTTKEHQVKTGESVWSISQLYGIKESKLRKWNNLSKTTEVNVGEKLKLGK